MKKRILSIVLCLSMALTLLPMAAFATEGTGVPTAEEPTQEPTVLLDESSWTYPASLPTPTWGGDGTEGTPYTIGTAQQLADLAYMVNNGTRHEGTSYAGKYFLLTGDIDLGNQPWTPIGQATASSTFNAFSGTFLGNNHTITGLNINSTPYNAYDEWESPAGLFGVIKNATVSDLTVDVNFNFLYANEIRSKNYWGKMDVGGLVGSLVDVCTVTNCHSSGSITTGVSNAGNLLPNRAEVSAGGLIGSYTGSNTTAATITNCSSSVNLTYQADSGRENDTPSIGGFVGCPWGGSTTSNCFATGDVTMKIGYNVEGIVYAGGFAGNNNKEAVITKSYATGAVTMHTPSVPNSTNMVVGGFIGSAANVSECYASGLVSGMDDAEESFALLIGGFAGMSQNYDQSDTANTIVENCYAAGNVAFAGKAGRSQAGGFVGRVYYKSTVQNCYSTGSVAQGASTGTNYAGGFAGYNGCTLKNCVALGASVTGGENTTPFCGYMGNTQIFENNKSYAGMLANSQKVVGTNANDKTGLSVPASGIRDNTAFDDWDTTVWTLTGNKLPLLTNVETAARDIPAHIKKVPVGQLSGTYTLTYGQPLSTLTPTGTMLDGETTVPGSFAWDDGTVTPNAGTYAAPWTFTPTDTELYAPAVGAQPLRLPRQM